MRPKYDWKTNDLEGRALRRCIKRTLSLAEKTRDSTAYNAYMRTLGYLCSVKGQLVKFEVERQIEERLSRLEAAVNSEVLRR